MANTCNIDGRLVAEASASVPVLDRGFLFGDSIYEVVRTVDGIPLAWTEHWERLNASAPGLRMALDLDEATVARRVQATIDESGFRSCYVRIIVTRGTGDAPNIDIATANGPPRWVIMVRPYESQSGKPARLHLVERLRNDRRALDPATKSGNYLNNVLALAEAKASGATDCLMVNADGVVTEASTSNLFARIHGIWCTPPLSAGILPGITRKMLLEFLPTCGEQVEERAFTADELRTADEMFLSSTLRDIGPVTHLDGRALHEGKPGPRTAELLPRFREYLAQRLSNRDAPRWRQLTAQG